MLGRLAQKPEHELIEFKFSCGRCNGSGYVTLEGHDAADQPGASYKSFKHQRFTDPLRTELDEDINISGQDLVKIYQSMEERYDKLHYNCKDFVRIVIAKAREITTRNS